MIPWIGGKQALCRAIISRFPADFRDRTYVEVFGGGASVLLNKERSVKEIYNDFNSNLVNLFRVVREHPKELQSALRYILNSREDFDAVKARLARGHYIDQILWAADFYQLIRQSYGGGGTSFGGNPRSMWASFPLIDAVAERFQYQVFAVCKANSMVSGCYQHTNFADAEEKAAFLTSVQNESLYYTAPVADQFITLSTCDISRRNGRVAVIGELVGKEGA